ncbi:MAG TPA: hypothetical protein VHM02_15550 [Thermoanaerobaculia bacterium]|nr:hypothetical protein [Thermoanaerobaculia bacterium]
MTTAASAGAAAAAAAAIAQAIKASGTLVRVEPEELRRILDRQEAPLVVVASKSGFFGEKHQYLTGYRGLAFYARSPRPIELPGTAEVVVARSIWMPS